MYEYIETDRETDMERESEQERAILQLSRRSEQQLLKSQVSRNVVGFFCSFIRSVSILEGTFFLSV